MDRAILEWLNAEARGQPWRVLAQIAAVGLVAVPLLVFAVLLAGRAVHRSSRAVSAAVVLVAGLAVAVAVNYGLTPVRHEQPASSKLKVPLSPRLT